MHIEDPSMAEEDYPKIEQELQPSQNYDMVPELDGRGPVLGEDRGNGGQ